ncbi:amidase [Auritidibacter ignavus]|uniref:Amidase n=1 Tax=Auritidibacter ignavus TaxID=678932 RepID=A0AAJ6ALY3_9MICC|nr:amidase [Auritidibacter ignavus]WGH92396.1 amidase [Auritidibacter ignavus]WHS29236.1 amidase [Auritidibacter ignavus]
MNHLSAVELRDQLSASAVSATEVTKYYLEQIRSRPELGALSHVNEDLARERAAALDELPVDHRAALHGIPTAFKDLVRVAGMPTRFGSRVFADAVSEPSNDPSAELLTEAGTVQVGKTTVPEFGLSTYSENLIDPPARNPRDMETTPTGSSGGAAAAVAAGLLPLAPGTDGGGSIRIPAAATGLVGLKPGRGTLSCDDQRETVTNLSVTGPLARTAADAALLMDAFMDPTSVAPGRYLHAVQQGAEGLAPMTIGVTTASPFHPDLQISLARGAVEALTQAASMLTQDEHLVTELDLIYFPGYHENFQIVWTSGLHRAPMPTTEGLDDLAEYFLTSTANLSADQIAEAEGNLTQWAQDTRAELGQTDIVLTPVLAFQPPKIGAFRELDPQANYDYQCRFTPYTSMINVMGLPAISIPVTDQWSVQAIGRPGTEAQLLALAARMEVLNPSNATKNKQPDEER